MTSKATSPGEKTSRRVRVLEMRKAGVSFSAIAKDVGVSCTQVFRDYHKALEEAACGRRMTKASERALELERLEIALLALIPKVRQGEIPAIDRWLKICESRRRLLGLNMKTASSLRSIKARQQSIKTYIGFDPEKV